MTRPPNPDAPKKILDEAERIVAEKGHHALNMRDLAERLGITPTTLYYYYRSKDHILLQLKLRAARPSEATRSRGTSIRLLGGE